MIPARGSGWGPDRPRDETGAPGPRKRDQCLGPHPDLPDPNPPTVPAPGGSNPGTFRSFCSRQPLGEAVAGGSRRPFPSLRGGPHLFAPHLVKDTWVAVQSARTARRAALQVGLHVSGVRAPGGHFWAWGRCVFALMRNDQTAFQHGCSSSPPRRSRLLPPQRPGLSLSCWGRSDRCSVVSPRRFRLHVPAGSGRRTPLRVLFCHLCPRFGGKLFRSFAHFPSL